MTAAQVFLTGAGCLDWMAETVSDTPRVEPVVAGQSMVMVGNDLGCRFTRIESYGVGLTTVD